MNSNILFYCWQLDLKTFGDLQDFKTKHKAKTNGELFAEMCKEYNRA